MITNITTTTTTTNTIIFTFKHNTFVDGTDGEIRTSKVFIREGTYQPEWLGLYLKGVKWLNVGFCRYKPLDGPLGFQDRVVAHAHQSEICFTSGAYLFSDQNVVDDVLLHEYCHILARSDSNTRANGHDQEWINLMVQFGLDPSPYAKYIYRS